MCINEYVLEVMSMIYIHVLKEFITPKIIVIETNQFKYFLLKKYLNTESCV